MKSDEAILPESAKVVKDYPDYFVDRDGNVFSKRLGHLRKLKPVFDGHYLCFAPMNDNGQVKRNIHRVVAETHLGPAPFPGAVVRHLNDVKTDNRLENLAWGSDKDNGRDAVRNNRIARGEKQGSSKLTDEQAREIRRRANSGQETVSALAREFGIARRTIRTIRDNRGWTHI